MNTIIKILQSSPPPFKQINHYFVPPHLTTQYQSQIFFTPKLQVIPYTKEFDRYIHFLRRKKYVQTKDLKEFTKNMITEFHAVMKEDRPQLQIIMQEDVRIPKGDLCPYYGLVDFMFSDNGYNPTPVLFFQDVHINHSAAIAAALSNLYIRQHLRKTHPQKHHKKQVHGFCIATTGHEWQMIRIDEKLKLHKTFVFEGTKNEHKNIYDDPQIMQTILGVCEFTIDRPRENVKVLEKAYEYLDEKRYMIEAETEEEANKQSLFSKAVNFLKKKK